MRRALTLVAALALGACLEVVEHAPAGACSVDSDCGCNLECNVVDAGFRFCGARATHSCVDNHDCQSRPDAGPHCLPATRDGGDCGYLICQ